MSAKTEEILVKELKKSWIYLSNNCAHKIETAMQTFGLDSCLAAYFSDAGKKLESKFKKDVVSFIDSYKFTETNVSILGMLAYLKWIDVQKNKNLFIESIAQLMKKQQNSKTLGFSTQIRLVTGAVFGYKAFGCTEESKLAWIKNILEQFIKGNDTDIRKKLLAKFLLNEIEGGNGLLAMFINASFYNSRDRVVGLWLAMNINDDSAQLHKIKENLITELHNTDTSGFDVIDSAMLCNIINRLLTNSSQILSEKGIDYLIGLLSDFGECSIKENSLKDEKDVQRVLWTVLRANYRDVVDEEYLKRFGLKNYKLDFGIKSLRTIVEAKYIGQKTDIKKIQDEILADSQGYLKSATEFDKIIFFIYDASPQLKIFNNNQFKGDLEQIKGVRKVIVIPGRKQA